ncbi:hypothetical protein X798_07545 [Onchocerca flexuosa]|uniref:Uncharacterized protein n=1 Tax=Onchocerca flexuosa TaxID=387005 RepID=A0A238BJC2_9BILA|nr:hypothetical protein X798_07545 [Onchocerca flexuosa]
MGRKPRAMIIDTPFSSVFKERAMQVCVRHICKHYTYSV